MIPQLALVLTPDLPNPEALALGPTVGWLTLICALAFVVVILLDLDRWRRFWLRSEDPRSIGLFRAVFAAAVLVNINMLWPQFEMLFTDEGMFMTDAARQVLAGNTFAGYGEAAAGEPEGFFDLAAFLTWIDGGRFSLLFFWDSPWAFWAQLVVFEIATIMFMFGWRSRVTGIISCALMMGFMHRNPVFQTGGDAVFRVMFVYLILARSGHAYSVDNWLRCRRLRAAGRLSERGPGSESGGGAGLAPSETDPEGRAAIYRRIPAWPRTLMILNLATIYLWTGCAKTGDVWARGDTLYYALNLDHFYRVPTQYLTSLMGTNVFRLMTWVVHFWQIGFCVVVLGLVVRWAIREGLERPSGWRRAGLRAAWVVLGLAASLIMWVAWPVHLPEQLIGWLGLFRWGSMVAWLLLMALIAWGWWRLRERPFELRLRARVWTLDLDTFMTIACGRRFWLTLGLIFHWHIYVLMNIGMFAPIMMITYIICLNGTEVASMLKQLGRGLARLGVPGIPSWIRDDEAITPSEDPSLPHLHHGRHEGFVLPDWCVGLGFALATCAVLLRVAEVEVWWPMLLLSVVAPGLSGALVHARSRARGGGGGGGAPGLGSREPWVWAHGPATRVLVGTLLSVGLTAICAWSIPDKDCTRSFRGPARDIVGHWIRPTHTYQSWNMFAPNPTRSNDFMHIYLTDAEGQTWDLMADVNSPRNKRYPWLIYSRRGKIARRVVGKGRGYQRWVARYHCRRWALDHDGALPQQVQIIKQWYDIPPPAVMRESGPYDPGAYLEAHGELEVLYTATCVSERDGQPTNELRARHGLAPAPAGQMRRAVKARRDSWRTRNERGERRVQDPASE